MTNQEEVIAYWRKKDISSFEISKALYPPDYHRPRAQSVYVDYVIELELEYFQGNISGVIKSKRILLPDEDRGETKERIVYSMLSELWKSIDKHDSVVVRPQLFVRINDDITQYIDDENIISNIYDIQEGLTTHSLFRVVGTDVDERGTTFDLYSLYNPDLESDRYFSEDKYSPERFDREFRELRAKKLDEGFDYDDLLFECDYDTLGAMDHRYLVKSGWLFGCTSKDVEEGNAEYLGVKVKIKEEAFNVVSKKIQDLDRIEIVLQKPNGESFRSHSFASDVDLGDFQYIAHRLQEELFYLSEKPLTEKHPYPTMSGLGIITDEHGWAIFQAFREHYKKDEYNNIEYVLNPETGEVVVQSSANDAFSNLEYFPSKTQLKKWIWKNIDSKSLCRKINQNLKIL
jgi:hypothetical protein